VLFHNGTVSDWKDYYRSFIASRDVADIPAYGMERMSDTRAMAYMVHHATELHEGEQQKLKAENLLQVFGSQSRWAILDADAYGNDEVNTVRRLGQWWYCSKVDSEEEAHRLHEGTNSLYEGGLLFSNKSWRSTATTT
jgi:hypothetical protein